MKSKEDFKMFVKAHPELISYVKNGEMTWQKFYELYNLYDDDDSAWASFLKSKTIPNNNEVSLKNITSIAGFTEIFNMIKNIKPEVIQQNITSIQKFLGFVSDLVDSSNKNNTNKQRNIYTPRPTHKMFED